MDEFDDVEVATISTGVGVQAADLAGGTGFSGEQHTFEAVPLIDYDEFVDRNESLTLLRASAVLFVYANSTETADGTVACAVEVSSSPAIQGSGLVTSTTTEFSQDPATDDVVGATAVDDTIDIIHREMVGVGHGPFSDGASGVGGGGSAGRDEVAVGRPPDPIADFHPRDELFLNGQFAAWNIDDAGIHAQFNAQHVYGVSRS